MDLSIDRRLGVDFPPDLRVAVHRARDRVRERHSQLTARLRSREVSSDEFAQGMQGIAAQLVEELASVLPAEDVEALLGIPSLGAAVLPLDPSLVGARRRR